MGQFIEVQISGSGIFVCQSFPSSALTLLVGRQEGHPACKTLGVGLLVVI